MARHVTPQGRGLGWRRQAPDPRDHIYAAPPHVVGRLPDTVDLRRDEPPVYDQGQLGSCVGNGVAGIMQHLRMKRGLPEGAKVPSRLAIYYGAREMEGSVRSDSGCEIRDAIKFVAANAVPFEDDWRYDISKFDQKPPVGSFTDAAIRYQAVPQSATHLMASLAEGHPVVFGFSCYSGLDNPETARNDFSDPSSGRLVMPRQNEASLGGHCVTLAGYDYPNRTFLVRNSWGPAWALRGYFLMPFEYVLRADLSSDFWNIQPA